MTDATFQTVPAAPPPALSGKMIANIGLGLAIFVSGFVLFEPAPYELLLSGLLAMALLFGMKIPREILPVILLVSLFSFGGLIGASNLQDFSGGVLYAVVTLFLGLTSVFFAIMIQNDMGRLRLIFRLYVISALLSTVPGILGYFGIPGFEIFTRYGRAQGVFADPNVFAPFLIPPCLYLMYGIMNRSAGLAPLRAGMLLVLLLGLFLAFSRAGWGLMVFTGALMYFLLLANEPSGRMRVKYIMLGMAGIVLLVGGIVVALQFDAIYSVFTQRAQVVQSYDGARLGRFARHAIGFEMALTKPLGLGVGEFGKSLGEDEHNVYLKSLLAYSWLGFVAWLGLMIWTLLAGFKLVFNHRPWQVYFQIAYVTFVGHLFVGWIIDIDRWRHFYLMLGIIWGCILLEKMHQKGKLQLN